MTYPMPEIPRFASVERTAEEFNCSVSSVRTAVKKGDIPSTRIGRHIRIPLRALVAKLEDEADEPEDDESASTEDASGESLKAAPGEEVSSG